MTKWEYQSVEGPAVPARILAQCKQFGLEGWELCGQLVMEMQVMGMNQQGVLVPQIVPAVCLLFKRPVESIAETADKLLAGVPPLEG